MTDSHQALLALAPPALPNFRVRRYLGDDFCLPLSAFLKEDSDRLQTLYGFLQEMQTALLPERATPVAPRVMELLRLHPADEIADLVRPLGQASYASAPSPLMAKTIHDLRGGGLTELLGQLQLAQGQAIEEPAMNALHFLTRDHLKIMRNALLGLDDAEAG